MCSCDCCDSSVPECCTNDCCEGECSYGMHAPGENPALSAVQNLIRERDEANHLAHNAKQAESKLVGELARIADQLKCQPAFEAVIAKLVEARTYISENEALRTTLAELEERIETCDSEHRPNDPEVAEHLRQLNKQLRERIAADNRTVITAGEYLQERDEIMEAISETLPPGTPCTGEAIRQGLAEYREAATLGSAQGAIGSMIAMIAKGIEDPGAAKNFVSLGFSWDAGILPTMPFRKAEVVFYRDGGKSPAQVASEAVSRAQTAEEVARCAREERDVALAKVTPATNEIVGRFYSNRVEHMARRGESHMHLNASLIGTRFDRVEIHMSFDEHTTLEARHRIDAIAARANANAVAQVFLYRR